MARRKAHKPRTLYAHWRRSVLINARAAKGTEPAALHANIPLLASASGKPVVPCAGLGELSGGELPGGCPGMRLV